MPDSRFAYAVIAPPLFCISCLVVDRIMTWTYARRRDTTLEAEQNYLVEKFTKLARLKVFCRVLSTLRWWYWTRCTDRFILRCHYRAPEINILTGFFKLEGVITDPIGQSPEIRLNICINDKFVKASSFPLVANGHDERAKLSIKQDNAELPSGAVPTTGEVEIKTWNIVPLRMCERGWRTCKVEIYTGQDVGEKRLSGFEGRAWIEGYLDSDDTHRQLS